MIAIRSCSSNRELTISFVSDSCLLAEHVQVELHGLEGSAEEWSVSAGIDYELGRLASLYADFDPK